MSNVAAYVVHFLVNGEEKTIGKVAENVDHAMDMICNSYKDDAEIFLTGCTLYTLRPAKILRTNEGKEEVLEGNAVLADGMLFYAVDKRNSKGETKKQCFVSRCALRPGNDEWIDCLIYGNDHAVSFQNWKHPILAN